MGSSTNRLAGRLLFLVLMSMSESACISAEAVPGPSEVDSEFQAQVRLLWSAVDTVVDRQIDRPTRERVLSEVVSRLLIPAKDRANAANVERLVKSTSAEEFAGPFLRLWRESPWPRDKPLVKLSELRNGASGQGLFQIVRDKDYAVEEQIQNNRYVGLGVRLGIAGDHQHPTIDTILPGGAAERAMLSPGVTILAIDGRSTDEMSLPEVVDGLRGPKGSQVCLKLDRHQGDPIREVTLTRSVVRMDSVYGREFSPVSQRNFRFNSNSPIGFLAVTQISASTIQELRDAEQLFWIDGIEAVVLDFRFNHRSASFHHARLLADSLMDGGTIWRRTERNTETVVEYADRERLFRQLPLVIVVNMSTDGPHAAVAAALQDSGQAVVVGDAPVFGGSAPAGIPLGDGFVLLLDMVRLIRSDPNRQWPLQPDHLVRQSGSPTFVLSRGVERGDSFVSALFPENVDRRELYNQIVKRGFTGDLADPLPLAHRVAHELLKQRQSTP